MVEIVDIFFGLVLILLGIYITFFVIKGFIDFIKVKRVTGIAEGVIIKSGVIHTYNQGGEHASHNYKTDVEYTYEVNSKEYTQRNIHYKSQVSGSEEGFVQAINIQFKKGKKVDIYYEIGNEENAWLINGIRPTTYFLLVIGVVCIGGGWMLVQSS